MAKQPRNATHPRHEEIAIRAYQFYLMEDRPGDHAMEHWLRAERELIQKRNQARAARMRREVQVVTPAIPASPVEAWCSGLDEPDEVIHLPAARGRAVLIA